VITICLEKLHRHPIELKDLPLSAFWEVIAVSIVNAEEEKKMMEDYGG
jgi:hypothetical protein